MRARFALILVLFLLASCGYRPARDVVGDGAHVVVDPGVSHVDVVGIADDASTGARLGLSELGVLAAAGDADASHLTLEVVRVEERSEGVAIASGGQVHARGVALHAIGRGVVRAARGDRTETSEIDAVEIVPSLTDPAAWEQARIAALRQAARSLGRQVAREAIGLP